ncbi:NAD(P)/FAD-dependent oxidoreductase [Streptomyces sp. GS7]|uniref:NAD(P)/FAD-dependent oxidoreductase n=1 Tax=Streptomyces sp. GS7 TaxID=2692234 RepID=UPI0013178537|nr:NAD(P)/FAD-dependent oxidoreductase [Streptomyces sp. GS7]QHC26905.1 FAD-dependent oxidoreductase [Streptomyces sp. GS7]
MDAKEAGGVGGLRGVRGVTDVVVVGAGAAGLNAALVLARARRSVAVVDAGAPRNAPAAHMHGFLSRDGMPPAALLEVGREELAWYGVQLINGQVDHVEDHGRAARAGDQGRGGGRGTSGQGMGDRPEGLVPGFTVHLAGGPALRARRVLVATGLRDELPGIPGVRERWGRDLLHCPYCHGYEVRDRPLGVLGTHPGAVAHALLLRQWSDDVVLFPHTLELTGEERERLAARGVRIAEGVVERLVAADDRLRGVELAEGRVVPRAAVFVFPRMVPRDALLTELGCERDEGGWVITDASGRTGVRGVWAAGNVADPRAQVVTAAGMGAAAAFAMNHDLVEEETERTVAAHRAGESAHSSAGSPAVSAVVGDAAIATGEVEVPAAADPTASARTGTGTGGGFGAGSGAVHGSGS